MNKSVKLLEWWNDTFNYPITENDLELCILILRKNRCSYGYIQKQLGNPSKKYIREVLLKYFPEWIEIQTKY